MAPADSRGSGGGGGFRKMMLGGMLLTLSLLLLSLHPVSGENPSYKECQPHIDATIRNLAAKAIVAGETPSEDIKIEDYSIEDEEAEAPPQPEEPETPEEPEGPEYIPDEEEQEPPVEPEPEEEVEEAEPVEEEEGPAEPEEPEELPVEAPVEPVSAKHVEPEKPTKEEAPKKVSPKPAPTPMPKEAPIEATGIVDKLVNAIIGLSKAERDPKWSQPWQTHPEFKKKKAAKEVPEAPKKVDTSGGIIHKVVSLIFEHPGETRDPKWSLPWQTHPEHKKKPAADKAVKEEKVVYGAMGGPIDKLVKIIFPVKEEGKREPKWAQPWQTHPEFARKAEEKKKSKEEEKKKVIHGDLGGPLDKLVRLIFPVKEEGKRDPKWAQPWQTHPEFARKAEEKKKSKEEEKKVIHGDLGGPLDKLVRLIFPVKEEGKREPKWAQPWQTHPEFARKAEEKKKAKEEKKVIHGDLGGPIDKLVRLIFPVKEEGKREPKWAQPWQTHPEFARKAEEKKKAKEEEKKVIHGDLGGPLDKLVKIMFETRKEGIPRDPKWAQPWQTHEEHLKRKGPVKDKPEPAPAPKPVPKAEPAVKPAPAPKAEPEPKAKPPTPAAKEEPKPAPKEPTPAPKPKPAAKEEPASKPKPVEAPETKPEELKPAKPTFPVEGPAGAPAAPPSAGAPPVDVTKAARKPVLEQEAPKAPPPPPPAPKEEQIVVVPSALRSRDHLEAILGLDEVSKDVATRVNPIADVTLKELKKVYESTIVPLQTLYKYQDISNRHVSDAELFGTPLVLLLGPYSTGKSSFINYMLGIEYTKRALKTGAPPSHGVFRVVQYGQRDAELDGTALSGHWSFTSLQKFGQNFVDQLQGWALDVPLLKKVTFVEAPGILEMRRPGERLYPFNDVLQWFIDRADLILVMFDYTKLDAGYELEAVLDQLKGREAQTRILLNKADQVPSEELIKVQGSLFWNLSPLLGVSSPPTVYVGSFTSQPYRISSPAKLFQAQEEALLTDLANAINARVENRIAIARRHAVRVRNHAQMVDSYLTTFYRNKGFLTSKHKLAEDIIENPHTYNIYEGVSLLTNISRYDLPDPEVYRDFFRVHNLYDFQTLKATCSYFRGCPLTKIDEAISTDLPELLQRYRRLVEAALSAPAPKAGRAAPVPAPPVRGNVPAAATARTS